MALGIRREQPPRFVDGNLLPHTGEDIGDLTLLRSCMKRAVCRKQWNPQPSGHIDDVLIAGFLLTAQVTLQLGVNATLSEDKNCFLEFGSTFGAGEANESFGMLSDLFYGCGAFALG